ncbi:Uncharacterised protein [Mycobacteroides abscessus subsp. abscessus]|nr:Uncharacterised protein [Mycobacteroides abscessus subsp. abscessus]
MWIESTDLDLPSEISTLHHELRRSHREARIIQDPLTVTSWFNLASGAIIALASIGGWRNPEESFFRVLHHAPGAPARDITALLFTNAETMYDPTGTGFERYAGVEARMTAKIRQTLNIHGK